MKYYTVLINNTNIKYAERSIPKGYIYFHYYDYYNSKLLLLLSLYQIYYS